MKIKGSLGCELGNADSNHKDETPEGQSPAYKIDLRLKKPTTGSLGQRHLDFKPLCYICVIRDISSTHL